MTALRVGLVGCSASKAGHPAPARELYTSPLFRKAAEYADRTCQAWWILSARYGVLAPTRTIRPYDETLVGATRDKRAEWNARVDAQLRYELRDNPDVHLVVLAGRVYRGFLALHDWSHEVPMAGLGIGQQLHWLTHQLKEI